MERIIVYHFEHVPSHQVPHANLDNSNEFYLAWMKYYSYKSKHASKFKAFLLSSQMNHIKETP